MKLTTLVAARIVACGLCGALLAAAAQASAMSVARPPTQEQSQGKPQDKPKVTVPEAELKAAKAVVAATDGDAAMKAAAEFVKKYPKSKIRSQVAEVVASKMAGTQDATRRAALTEEYLKVFNAPEEANVIAPVQLEAYLGANRYDEAFRVGGAWLDKNPGELTGRTRLALIGIDQARRGNAKFVPQSQQYATRAIELIESGRRPAEMNEETWNEYRTVWLPQLYESLGILSLVSSNSAEARAKLEKAASLGLSDPTGYALLGQLSDDEYQATAKEVNAMPAGAARDAAFKNAQTQLDKVIDYYAHAVALAEGKPQFEQMRAQLMSALTSYYKFRKGSTDGLQELIDKYKKPSGQGQQ